MTQAYSNNADFSDINPNIPMKILNIIHKAYLKVNKNGVEATAVTAVIIGFACARSDPPHEMIVNKMFVVLIKHVNSDNILFVGKIEKL